MKALRLMEISREMALIILKYMEQNNAFDFPFIITCKEYTIEDDDFVEIEPSEYENIQDDTAYQTFELVSCSWADRLFGYETNTIIAKKCMVEILFYTLLADCQDHIKFFDNDFRQKMELYSNLVMCS